MNRVTIPLDSVAVVAEWRTGFSRSIASVVWSEELARVIAEHLTASGELRVVPHARVTARANSGDYSPEEIARHFNARAALHVAVTVVDGNIDVRVELIDAFAESVLCESSFLVSMNEAVSVQKQILCWLGCCLDSAAPSRTITAIELQAKTLARQGRFAEALAMLPPDAQRTFAEIVIDAPSRALNAEWIARACEAANDADDLVAARIFCRFARDWAAANAAFERAVSRNGDPAAHAHRALFLAAMRRPDDAERELRIANELCDPLLPERALIDRGFAYCGRGGDARIVVDDRYADAIVHASRGETKKALDALRDAVMMVSPYVMFAAIDPSLMVIRHERRFIDEVFRPLHMEFTVTAT